MNSRAGSNGDVTDTKLGIIGILNDRNFRNQLSLEIRYSLWEKEVSFSAYDASELNLVLYQYKQVVFQDGILGGGITSPRWADDRKERGDACISGYSPDPLFIYFPWAHIYTSIHTKYKIYLSMNFESVSVQEIRTTTPGGQPSS